MRKKQARQAGRGSSPAELFTYSFVALIVAGSLALKWLPGLYTGPGLSWTDAVFTSASAVCVTGLIVVDTATYFTWYGQALILLLIQAGGLGMLVLTSVLISALGGRPSLRAELMAAGGREILPHLPARQLVRDIVLFTVLIEGLGAIALYLIWGPKLGWWEAIWPAVFHSISAFCNAGFSTNTLSLIEYQQSPATLLVISLLVVIGGLGFITIEELARRGWIGFGRGRQVARRRISVHSRMVLWGTALLILIPWPFFTLFEWNGVLQDLQARDKLMNGLFMSITPRTAGFNAIDYAQASDSANFLTIILMMIGGSPGSTAGGMKTTTLMLLTLLAWSRLRGQPTTVFGNRSIPEVTIQRATGLFVIANGLVIGGVFFVTFWGDVHQLKHEFLVYLFETASAFNTVGLSLGLTADLPVPSKWFLVALMLAGRVGPLSLAAALGNRLTNGARHRLAYEDVVIG